MPTSPPSLCTNHCGTLVYGGGQCPDCLTETRRERDKRRPNRHARGYTNVWAAFAKDFLADNPYCVSEKHRGLEVIATDVDHIDGLGPNGPRGFDRSNLAPYCHSCHSSKTARYDGGFGHVEKEDDFMPWAPRQKCATPSCPNLVDHGWCKDCQRKNLAEIHLTVVAGPPGAGKTTYVNQHKQDGDLVVDLDAIAVALGSTTDHAHDLRLLPFMYAARDAVLERMTRPNDLRHVWVIRGAAKITERNEWWQAKVIVLAIPAPECKRRAHAAGRPPLWNKLIDTWWDQYQPNPADTVITD